MAKACKSCSRIRASSTWPATRKQGNQAQPQLFKADVSLLLDGDEVLQEEVFGPTTVVVEVADQAQLSAALNGLHGQLTATIIGEPADFEQFGELTALLEQKVGRDPAQWLSDRRGSLRFDGPRRAVPGDVRCARHVGGHPGDRSLPAPGVLPELPGQLAAGRAEERQSAAASSAWWMASHPARRSSQHRDFLC